MNAKWEKIKYQCSKEMEPYLESIDIDEDTINFCKKYVPWLINPIFTIKENLILLKFPGLDYDAMDWPKIIGDVENNRYVPIEWEFNYVDTLNDYLPQVEPSLLKNVAFFIYNTLKLSLKSNFPLYYFQVVITYDMECNMYRIRFYHCRDNEYIMIDSVDDFHSPILAEII